MNALKKFLGKKSKAKVSKGDLGQESEWLEFSAMNLKGKRLLICDAMYVPAEDNGLETKLSPGHYLIQAKVMSYGGDRRVSRLRILPPETEVKLGGVIGETGTDTALIAVCDLEVCAKASEALGEDKMEDICNDLLDKGDNCGVMVLDKKTEAVAPYVSSGFGDGTFKVFKLLNNRKTVGVEIEFIKTGTPYPFDLAAKSVSPVLSGDKSAREKSPADAFLQIFIDAGKEKTGDRIKDRESINRKFEEFKANAENELKQAWDNFHKHIVSLRRTAPALQIQYVPSKDGSWMRKPEINERIQFLESAGFSLVGFYNAPPIADYSVALFIRQSDGIVAEVSLSQGKIPTLYFCSIYANGDLYFAIDKPASPGVPNPPFRSGENSPDLSPRELLETFVKKRPVNQMRLIRALEIVPLFEKYFCETQKRRAERGGWTPDEIKQQLGIGDELESKDRYDSARHAVGEKWLYSWLKLQSGLKFDPEAVIGQLVIIHDNLTTDYLSTTYGCFVRDLNVRDKMFIGENARAAFAKVNQERGNKLRLVAQKHTPIEADFYLPI